VNQRFVICCDGTWQASDGGDGTHVLRVANAVRPAGADRLRQGVFYGAGVGAYGAVGHRVRVGITGAGLDRTILDAYEFLVRNYLPDDGLFFFGFSRGAYTVRSLAGLIRNCGILKRKHAGRVSEAMALYRKRRDDSHPESEQARQFRKQFAVADESPIEFVGVWDTVGALGIPLKIMERQNLRRYRFHDTSPSRIIRHARHAVARHETRVDFEPTLWEPKPGVDLVEKWFDGVHADIGGARAADRRLGDIAGKWMAEQAAACGLDLEPYYWHALAPDPQGTIGPVPRGYRLRPRRLRVEAG
jgi:uncharacterized protein (DUF2235 family)